MQTSPRSRNPLVPRARRAATALIALVLGACASYPLGMSEAEWKRLTPEQQMEARNKQAELNRARAQQRAQQAAARRQRYAAMEAAEQRRLAELYEAARYGDIVDCVIDGGVGDFQARRRPFGPIAFTLARGEYKAMALDGSRFWASYSTDGNHLRICYRDPRHFGYRACASVGDRSNDFAYGISRRADVRHVFRGARIACAFRPGDGMPRWVMHRRNVEVYRVIRHHHHYRDHGSRGRVVIRDHGGDRRYQQRRPRPGVMTHERGYEPAPSRSTTVIREHQHDRDRSRRETVIRRDDRAPAPASTRGSHERDTVRQSPTDDGSRRYRAPPSQPAPSPMPPSVRDRRPATPTPAASTARRPEPAPRVPSHARARDNASPRSAVHRGAPPPRAVSPRRVVPDGGPATAAAHGKGKNKKQAGEPQVGEAETPPGKRGGATRGRGDD